MATTKTRKVIVERLNFWQEVYEKYQKAYIALIEGGVKSYTVDDRSLSRFDLGEISRRMEEAEEKIDEYAALLDGGRPRKAFAIVPRDW